MKTMDIERGDVLARGINYRRLLNSEKGKRTAFFHVTLIFLIAVFIICELLWVNSWVLVNTGAMFLTIFVLFFSLMGLWVFRPSTWNQLDIIYENGISSTSTPFLPFSEVEKIGYGTFESSTEGHVNFIIVFGIGRDWQKCPYIWDAEYTNDYYEKAIELLKQKLPDVPWVQMEWLEWKKKNKKKEDDKK